MKPPESLEEGEVAGGRVSWEDEACLVGKSRGRQPEGRPSVTMSDQRVLKETDLAFSCSWSGRLSPSSCAISPGALSVCLANVTHLGTWLNKPRISVDPTEQQRVMLLSRSPSGPKKYFPIPVGHLEEEIRVRSADDCKRFREEFNVSLGPLFLVTWKGAGTWDVVFQDKLAQRLRMLASIETLSQKWGSRETWFLP